MTIFRQHWPKPAFAARSCRLWVLTGARPNLSQRQSAVASRSARPAAATADRLQFHLFLNIPTGGILPRVKTEHVNSGAGPKAKGRVRDPHAPMQQIRPYADTGRNPLLKPSASPAHILPP